jgi:alkaline phosphatase D
LLTTFDQGERKMLFTRRQLLKVSATYAAGMLFPLAPLAFAAAKEKKIRKTLSIVQGATDDSNTQFSILHPAGTAITVNAIFRGAQVIAPIKTQRHTFSKHETAVTHAFFSDLPAGEDIALVIKDKKGKVLDQRVFRTLDSRKKSFKFAICSCMDDEHHQPEIWNDLLAQSPDVIFFIGDSTYVDQEANVLQPADPARLWRRFCEARETLEIYHQKRLTPILAVWDDHDFGDNDTNSKEYPYIKETQKNFLTFFPSNPEFCRYLDRGPGISSCFRYLGQQIILMDDRSFRMPSGDKNPHAHWGREQERWALKRVQEQREVSWIMNGSQFFPNVVWKESVSRNHPEQLEGFSNQIKKSRKKVIFASGDVHYSEISRIEPEILGYETFEVTSSSIHSKNFPGFPGLVPNHRRIMSTGERNYVLVSCGDSGEPSFKVQSRSPGGVVRFEKRIDL